LFAGAAAGAVGGPVVASDALPRTGAANARLPSFTCLGAGERRGDKCSDVYDDVGVTDAVDAGAVADADEAIETGCECFREASELVAEDAPGTWGGGGEGGGASIALTTGSTGSCVLVAGGAFTDRDEEGTVGVVGTATGEAGVVAGVDRGAGVCVAAGITSGGSGGSSAKRVGQQSSRANDTKEIRQRSMAIGTEAALSPLADWAVAPEASRRCRQNFA